jgi:hypothetical protein
MGEAQEGEGEGGRRFRRVRGAPPHSNPPPPPPPARAPRLPLSETSRAFIRKTLTLFFEPLQPCVEFVLCSVGDGTSLYV